MQNDLRNQLAVALKNVAAKTKASSVHATFVTEADLASFSNADYLHRYDQQFHWVNDHYNSFDDFLASLSSRKRKSIKRERREAVSAGIAIEWVTGSDLKEHHWDAFFEFNVNGQKYFTNSREVVSEKQVEEVKNAIQQKQLTLKNTYGDIIQQIFNHQNRMTLLDSGVKFTRLNATL